MKNLNIIVAVLAAAVLNLLASTGILAQTVEFDSDRLGADFDRVTMAFEDYKLCQSICSQTKECVAWTYTPVGFDGYETPQCWLKDRAPRAIERSNTVSGTFPERMAEKGIAEGPEPTAAEVQNAVDQCKADTFSPHWCLLDKAIEEMDPAYCHQHSDSTKIAACLDSAGFHIMEKCKTLSGNDRDLCTGAVIVQFPSPKSCFDSETEEYDMTCVMTMAAVEHADPARFFSLVESLPPLERDQYIAGYGYLTQDYSVLDLIHDNRLHDLAVIGISTTRIGAGKYVEPGICNSLVGNYSPYDDDLSAASQKELCFQSVAMGRVLVDYARDKSMEEVFALQGKLQEFLITDMDYAVLPADLAGKMKTAMDAARVEFQAASPGVSGSMPVPEPTPSPGYQGAMPEAEGTNEGGSCLFGLCDL